MVKRGDTLSALALKYGVSARAIAEQNGMSVKQPISVGETLRIPNADKGGAGSGASEGGSPGGGSSRGGASSDDGGGAKKNVYVVQAGDTLAAIARKQLGSSGLWEAIYELNKSEIGSDPGAIQIGMKLKMPEKSTRR